MLMLLPPSSRVSRRLSEGAFTTDQHLMATAVDLLSQIHWQTSITAAGTVGEQWSGLQKDSPTPMKRPGQVEEAEAEKTYEEPVFTSGKELSGLNFKAGNIVIAHTPECVQSEINKSGELNCSCPPE